MSSIEITEGTATVVNGELVVTLSEVIDVFVGDSAYFVLSNGTDFGYGRVVGRASSNSLSLAQPWRFSSITNGDFTLFNTLEGLSDAVQKLSDKLAEVRELSDEYEALLDSATVTPDADTLVRRTSDGRVKAADGTESDDALTVGQTSEFSRTLLPQQGAGDWRIALELGTASTRNVGVSNGNIAEYTANGLSGFGYGSLTPPTFALTTKSTGSGFGQIVGGEANAPSWLQGGRGAACFYGQESATRSAAIVLGGGGNGFARAEIYTFAGEEVRRATLWSDENLTDPATLSGDQTFTGERTFSSANYGRQIVIRRTTSADAQVSYENSNGLLGLLGYNAVRSLQARNSSNNEIFSVTDAGNARVYGNLQVDGTINEGSDIRLKDNAKTLIDEEVLMQVWPNVRSKLFQWKHAIEEKGEDARWHAGYMVQEIEQAFIDAGIDPEPFALWAKTPIEEDVETGEFESEWRPVTTTETYTEERIEMVEGVATLVTEEKTREVPVMIECEVCCEDGELLTDDDGNPVKKMMPKHEKVQVPITERRVVDHSYHLRYSQVLVWETTYLRKRLDLLEDALK